MKKRSLLSLVLAFAICTAMLLSAPLSGVASAAGESKTSGQFELSWTEETGSINYNWTPPATGVVTFVADAGQMHHGVDYYFQVDGSDVWPDADGKMQKQLKVEKGTDVLFSAGYPGWPAVSGKVVVRFEYESSGGSSGGTELSGKFQVAWTKEEPVTTYIWDAPVTGTVTFVLDPAGLEYGIHYYFQVKTDEVRPDKDGKCRYTMDVEAGQSILINVGCPRPPFTENSVAISYQYGSGGGDTEVPPEYNYFELNKNMTLDKDKYFKYDATQNGTLRLDFTGKVTNGPGKVEMKVDGNDASLVSMVCTKGTPSTLFLELKSGESAIIVATAGYVGAVIKFIPEGSEGQGETDPAIGTEQNPEELKSIDKLEVVLQKGEYYYMWTADKTGKLTLKTTGDGSQNLVVWLNGDKDKPHSNWDGENNGEHITIDVKKGDVLVLKAFFKDAGAGTMIVEGAIEEDSGEVNPPTGDGIYAIALMGMAAMTGLAVVASKKKAF